jgi:cytochrome c5
VSAVTANILKRTIRLLTASLLVGVLPAQAQELSFSADQVEAGTAVYKETCQLCHGTSLSNGQFGTPLRGNYFRKKWGGKTLGELLQFTLESMPPDNKGGLPAEQYAAALAYILSRNEVATGATAMPTDPLVLQTVPLPWPAP